MGGGTANSAQMRGEQRPRARGDLAREAALVYSVPRIIDELSAAGIQIDDADALEENLYRMRRGEIGFDAPEIVDVFEREEQDQCGDEPGETSERDPRSGGPDS